MYSIENLSFSYDGKKQILCNLNLHIEQGKITTILGKNGCGKTTLLNVLAKNLTNYAGNVSFADRPLKNYSKKEYAQNVAMVYQKNTIPDELTIYDLVAFGRLPHKKNMFSPSTAEDLEKIDFALTVTNLRDLQEELVLAVSGGQAQRVFLAMALAQGTRTILLDEPTTFLDVEYQRHIMQLVQTLNRDYGYTVVMVLHDVNQALRYSDNVVALKAGEVIYSGLATDAYDENILADIYDTDFEIAHHAGKEIIVSW